MNIYKIEQKIIAKIVKAEEDEILNEITDYARKNNAELILLDEDKVKAIIDLGIKEYIKIRGCLN